MAKPDFSKVFSKNAGSSDMVNPDDTTPGKFESGWALEVPPYQHFNWIQNYFSRGVSYFNERGIPEYDAITDYPLNAIQMASDGTVYKCVAINGPASTVVDPIADDGSFWSTWDPSGGDTFNDYLKGPRDNGLSNIIIFDLDTLFYNIDGLVINTNANRPPGLPPGEEAFLFIKMGDAITDGVMTIIGNGATSQGKMWRRFINGGVWDGSWEEITHSVLADNSVNIASDVVVKPATASQAVGPVTDFILTAGIYTVSRYIGNDGVIEISELGAGTWEILRDFSVDPNATQVISDGVNVRFSVLAGTTLNFLRLY